MKEIAIPTKDACLAVMNYIQFSEMEGRIDETDPWYSTYKLIEELMTDKVDDGDLSYINIDDDDEPSIKLKANHGYQCHYESYLQHMFSGKYSIEDIVKYSNIARNDIDWLKQAHTAAN